MGRTWLALLLLTGLAWAQQDIHQQAEALYGSLPAARRIVKANFVNTDNEEARLDQACEKTSQQSSDSIAEIARIADDLQTQYGDNDQAKMADPRWARMVALSQSSSVTQASANDQLAYERRDRYLRGTLEWLKKRGRGQARGYEGTMVLMLDGPLDQRKPGQEIRFSCIVEFRMENAFFQSNLGRKAWTGGYRLRFQSDETGPERGFGWQIEPRTVDRPGKAFSTLYLGRDGWFLKFHPLRSQDFPVPLPTLSNRLLNLAYLDRPDLSLPMAAGTTNGEPGDRVAGPDGQVLEMGRLQGFPFDPSGPRQAGAVEYTRPSGARVRVSYDFSPL